MELCNKVSDSSLLALYGGYISHPRYVVEVILLKEDD